MTTLESSFDQTTGGAQKTSGLAIASLVCSLVCCLPITTVPAILLGIGGIVSIRGNPAKKGMGLAVTGLVLGLIFTGTQALIYPKGWELVKESMELVTNGPNNAMTKGFDGDIAGFKASFYGTGASATDGEAQAFLDAVSDRYGTLQGVEFDETRQQQQNFGSPSAIFPYVFDFSSGTVDGEAEIVFSDAQRGGFVFKLGSITILDPDRGDLNYPAAAGQTPPAPPLQPAPDPAAPPPATAPDQTTGDGATGASGDTAGTGHDD